MGQQQPPRLVLAGQAMVHWKSHLEEALCWTVLAPIVRAKRQQRQARRAAEFHDRQRIDRLLSEIVRQHGDLLC
ncbi:MAG: hypothetical protein CMA86_04075 [Euryarchaeota archaeon]|nr:hypothetical protein [Euryarchaeota archaeon]